MEVDGYEKLKGKTNIPLDMAFPINSDSVSPHRRLGYTLNSTLKAGKREELQFFRQVEILANFNRTLS